MRQRSSAWLIRYTCDEVRHELKCYLSRQPNYEVAVCAIAFGAPADAYVYPNAKDDATGFDRALAFLTTNGITDVAIERHNESESKERSEETSVFTR